jgi:hypothetical protein
VRVDQSLVERPYIGLFQGQVINRGRGGVDGRFDYGEVNNQ